MNEMIERLIDNVMQPIPVEIKGTEQKTEALIPRAVAAWIVWRFLCAMREPTEAMLDAPWRHPGIQVYEPTDLTQVLDCISFAEIWKAMIGKALED